MARSGIPLAPLFAALMASTTGAAEPRLPPMTGGMAAVAGPALYYEECGRGPAVVLIHGVQMDRRIWDDQVAALAEHFRVIRYDVRGYGRSPQGTHRYSDV